MIRKIIKINTEKCNGCGACATACHEGAIEMIDGKAVLTRENYCDGLGDCLPACPMDAISFEMREAPAYDEAAVLASKKLKEGQHTLHKGGCPSTRPSSCPSAQPTACPSSQASCLGADAPMALHTWPVQIKLLPVTAPFFDGADLLIAADCTAYTYSRFHQDFIRDRVTIIGCPKLDACDYAVKLAEIFAHNDIKSITVVRMQVPCCGGLTYAVERALQTSGKQIPLRVTTISTTGDIVL